MDGLNRRTLLQAGLGAGAAAMLPGMVKAAQMMPRNKWELLFNGVDLTGWTFFQEGVGGADKLGAASVEDGVLHLLGPAYKSADNPGFGHVATERSYSNYHLRLDFRYGERRFAPRSNAKKNSGVLYHMGPARDVLYPDCVEFQLEESDVGDSILVNVQGLEGTSLGGTPVWPSYPPFLPRRYPEPLQFGGLARQSYRKTGDFEVRGGWNTIDLIAFEDQAAHIVNGTVVTSVFGLIEKPVPGKPAISLTGGRIALELEGAEISFKNVMIRQLSAEDIAEIRKG